MEIRIIEVLLYHQYGGVIVKGYGSSPVGGFTNLRGPDARHLGDINVLKL